MSHHKEKRSKKQERLEGMEKARHGEGFLRSEKLTSADFWLLLEHSPEVKQLIQKIAENTSSNIPSVNQNTPIPSQQLNKPLSGQQTAVQQQENERLVTFLPALYLQAFTHLNGADLALLCGKVTPFDIPNPYLEPAPETLSTLQIRFKKLDLALQKRIIGFIKDTPYKQKLNPRPEMAALINKIEQEC